jgi:hypothetical protein
MMHGPFERMEGFLTSSGRSHIKSSGSNNETMSSFSSATLNANVMLAFTAF